MKERKVERVRERYREVQKDRVRTGEVERGRES